MAVIMANGRLSMYSPTSAWQDSSAGVVSAGVWNHVARVVKNNIVTFYVSGNYVGAKAMTILNNYPADTVKL